MSALVVRSTQIALPESWVVQRALADLRRADRIPDVVWLLEHPPVYTYGRHGRRGDLFASDEDLATLGGSVHQLDRGGQMTWHGPGQCTAYVIWRLSGRMGVRRFVETLTEAARVATGLDDAQTRADAPGVYREGRKLASVGIRVQGRASTHGLAINRDCDLAWFARMTACGLPDVPATSIAAEGGEASRTGVEDRLIAALGAGFETSFAEADLAALLDHPSA